MQPKTDLNLNNLFNFYTKFLHIVFAYVLSNS